MQEPLRYVHFNQVFVLSVERKGKLVSDLPYELARDVWKLVINVYELQFWL